MAIEGIIGKKVGMTQVFAEDGALVPVTVIQAGPCLVVQKKTTETDGYDAVQIGLVEKVSNRRITAAQRWVAIAGRNEWAERLLAAYDLAKFRTLFLAGERLDPKPRRFESRGQRSRKRGLACA